MAFPEAERVIYEKNPLEEVICQLRFPPILKIDSETPTEFQECIRNQYPLYQTKSIGKLPAGLPDDLAKILAVDFSILPTGKAHEFVSRDEKWRLSLTKTFLALSCSQYRRWEDFKEHLQRPLLALEGIYKPAFYTRLGLRYRDVIRRSVLSLGEAAWSELLQPWIAGAIAQPEIADDIQENEAAFLAKLPDNQGSVRVRHGIALDEATKERCYLIDADFFDEAQTETPHAVDKLDYLNRQSRYLFRWCISDRLHQAMVPRAIALP